MKKIDENVEYCLLLRMLSAAAIVMYEEVRAGFGFNRVKLLKNLFLTHYLTLGGDLYLDHDRISCNRQITLYNYRPS